MLGNKRKRFNHNIMLLFQSNGIIDVTRFDATPENPEIGYMRGGTVSVYSDGRIHIHDGDEELEVFLVRDVIRMNTNINSYDPEHSTEVALLLESRSIRITFPDVNMKRRFAEALQWPEINSSATE